MKKRAIARDPLIVSPFASCINRAIILSRHERIFLDADQVSRYIRGFSSSPRRRRRNRTSCMPYLSSVLLPLARPRPALPSRFVSVSPRIPRRSSSHRVMTCRLSDREARQHNSSHETIGTRHRRQYADEHTRGWRNVIE